MTITRSLAALGLIVAVTFPAFSAGQGEDTQEIRVQTRWATDAPHEAAFQDLLREYDEMNENITVVDESVGDEIAFNDRLQTAIATGNTPHVVYTLGGARFAERVENDVYMDLRPALEAEPDWFDFFIPLFDNWQIDGDEGIYGVPYESFGVGLYYNRRIFDELGLEPPQTIEAFEEVSDALLEEDIIPLAIGNSGVWRGGHLFTNLIYKRHGSEIAERLANRELSWDSDEVIEILTLMDEWHDSGYLGENVVAGDYDEEQALFHGGDTAMHMDGSWYISSANASQIADHIGFLPFPHFSDYSQYAGHWMGGAAGGLSLSGTMNEAEEEVATDLLRFLTSNHAFAYIQEQVGGGVYPVRLESDEDLIDPLTIEHSESLGTAEVLRTDIDTYDPLPQMTDRVRNSIQGMFAGASPEETAAEIQSTIDQN